MLRLALRGMRAHRGRLALSAVAIVLGVSFVTASFVVTDSLESIFSAVVRDVNADVDLVVRTEAGPQRAPLADAALGIVRDTPGVAAAAGFVGGFVQVVTDDGTAVSPAAGAPLALSWPAEEALTALRPIEGRRPAAAGEVAVDRRTANEWSIRLGEQVRIAGRASEPAPFTVVGIAGFGSGDYPGGSALFAFDIGTVQQLTGAGSSYDSILVELQAGAPTEQVRLLLVERVPGDRIEVVTRNQVVAEGRDNIDAGLRFLRIGLYGFALVSIIVAGFLIVNTFGVVVAQRTRELGLLAAVGATPRQLFGSVVAEAAILGGAASAVGIALGWAGAVGLRSLLGVFDLDLPAGSLPLRPSTIAIALVLGTGATVFSAAVPARRAATIPPMAAIRTGFVTGGRVRAGRLAAGIVLALVSYGIATAGLAGWTGNAPATVGIAAVCALASLVALGPALSAATASAIRRSRTMPKRLAADGVRRQPVRVAATSSALAVGVSLVTGISVFGASATTSLHRDLTEGLTAELVVEADQFLDLGGFVAERLSSQPEVASVVPVRQAQVVTTQTRELLTGVDIAQLSAVLDIDLLRGELEPLLTQPGIAVQEDAARHLDVDVGDDLVVDFPLLGKRSVTVFAIYGNGSIVGGLLTSDQLFTATAGDRGADLLLVDAAPGIDPATAARGLEAALTDLPFVHVRSPAAYEAVRTEQVDRLLALTAVLLGVAIAVAVLGVANTVALSVLERRRELGLLRAVGMTPGQMESMVTWEAIVVAVVGVVGGAVLGVALGLAFVFSLSGSGITSVDVPAVRILAFCLLGGVSAVAAATVPARRAGRAEVLDAIAVE